MAKDLGGVTFNDYSPQVLAEMHDAVLRALERIGERAEGYAKDLCPTDTGQLQNSISHAVEDAENAVYIGVPGGPTSYGTYVELGTGIYAEGGGGRPTPWVYQDAKGNWHWTRGNPAQPFLAPAVKDHQQTYRNIIEDELKNG